jgi:hypothetical protein
MKTAGFLPAEDTRGYRWRFTGGAVGAVINADVQGHSYSFTVEKHRTQLSFSETDRHLRCEIKIDLTGRERGYSPSGSTPPGEIINFYTDTVTDELLSTAEKMKTEWAMDGLRLTDELKKKNIGLYKKYEKNLTRAWTKMELIPKVTVRISE